MNRFELLLVAAAATVSLGGCAYYAVPVTPVPVTQTTTTPANFDRSYNAALGAMQDQGLAISRNDAGGGVIVGSREQSTVTASITRQADGSVRVSFDGSSAQDPGLVDRVTRSYQSRMGR
jgi:hypothetical protein